MTHEQADQILLALKAAYTHADTNLDPAQAKARDAIYRRIFLTWGFGAAQEAILAATLSCKFYPMPAELHSAYVEANRARPQPVANVLPKPGDTVASPEEVLAALAAATAAVDANVNVNTRKPSQILAEQREHVADAETEADMIRRTLARTGREAT